MNFSDIYRTYRTFIGHSGKLCSSKASQLIGHLSDISDTRKAESQIGARFIGHIGQTCRACEETNLSRSIRRQFFDSLSAARVPL